MKRRMARWLAVAAAALLAGCLQIETRIKLNEDGSAWVTERVAFSRRLLELTGGPQGECAALLGKERFLERMKAMGEGITLVKHESRANEDGSLEATAEYALTNLDGFRYVSPWLGHPDYASNSAIRVRLAPRHKQLQWSERTAGAMEVRFEYEKPTRKPGTPGKNAPPPLAPLDEQVYRDLAPVFRELLRDFRARLTFEGYAPPVWKRVGSSAVRSAEVDLLNVSDNGFFDGENRMLDLARLNFAGPRLLADRGGAMFEPFVFSVGNGWSSAYDGIWLPPSKPLFDRHFAGTKLELIVEGNQRKEVPARFEDIGWRGWQGKLEEPAPAPAGAQTVPAAGGK